MRNFILYICFNYGVGVIFTFFGFVEIALQTAMVNINVTFLMVCYIFF